MGNKSFYSIEILPHRKSYAVPLTRLKKRMIFALQELSKIKKHGLNRPWQVNVLLVGDKAMARWHEKAFNDPTPTDVISFPMREGRKMLGAQNILGEMVVSVDTAKREALKRGHSFENELSLYLLHGLLHLLGYQDTLPRKKKKMDQVQFALFKKVMRMRW